MSWIEKTQAISMISTIKFSEQTFWNIYSLEVKIGTKWNISEWCMAKIELRRAAWLVSQSSIPLSIHANAIFEKFTFDVLHNFVYVNFSSDRVRQRKKVGVRENARIVYLCNSKMTHFAGFRLKEKLMAWNGKILYSKCTPWTCVYLFHFGFIPSARCTLSACTHFDTLHRTIVPEKCKCTKKRNKTKRMQEWMNEQTVNAMKKKVAADSSTYTNHVILWKLCALHTYTRNHTKYYKMRNWKCWKLEQQQRRHSWEAKMIGMLDALWSTCMLSQTHEHGGAHTTII